VLFSAADLAEFLGPSGDFGETVTIAGADLSAVFFDGYTESLNIQGSSPALLCRAQDVDAVAEGAAVAVPSAGSFTVATVEKDSQGLAQVTLQAVG